MCRKSMIWHTVPRTLTFHSERKREDITSLQHTIRKTVTGVVFKPGSREITSKFQKSVVRYWKMSLWLWSKRCLLILNVYACKSYDRLLCNIKNEGTPAICDKHGHKEQETWKQRGNLGSHLKSNSVILWGTQSWSRRVTNSRWAWRGIGTILEIL